MYLIDSLVKRMKQVISLFQDANQTKRLYYSSDL